MYNLEKITNEFNQICNKAGVTNKCPVSINGRLTKTLGRVRYVSINSKIEPIGVEFSRQFIETASDTSISDVIKHEAAHLITAERTHINHGHDAYFKAVCAEVGTTNDGCSYRVENIKAIKYKYTIICPNCGEIGGYDRMCKTVREIKYCSCKRCGSSNLKVAT